MNKDLQLAHFGITCTLSTFFLVALIDLSPTYILERNRRNKCAEESFLADATAEMEIIVQREEKQPGRR